MSLIECVPNVSEGQNPEIIHQLAEAIRSVDQVKLLHQDSGYAANRTVFTFIGPPEAVTEGAFALYQKSMELLDMSTQKGTHPRQGLVDVCPFIPLKDYSLKEAIMLSRNFAKRVAKELELAVYLYEYSASQPKRSNLAVLRKGEYESLPEKFEELPPDFGPIHNWQKAGVSTIGARKLLVAYNVNLNTKDVNIAKTIAEIVRESGKVVTDSYGKREKIPGRFKSVKAIGWFIDDFECAQVSYNLTDIEQAGMLDVFLATKEEAKKLGFEATGSELVGLAPLSELLKAGNYFNGSIPASEKLTLQSGINGLGLDDLNEFKPNRKIIEYLI